MKSQNFSSLTCVALDQAGTNRGSTNANVTYNVAQFANLFVHALKMRT